MRATTSADGNAPSVLKPCVRYWRTNPTPARLPILGSPRDGIREPYVRDSNPGKNSGPATRPLELTGFYSSPNLTLKFRGLFLDCFQECEPLLARHRHLGAVFRVKNPQEALKTIDDITQLARVFVGQDGLDDAQPLPPVRNFAVSCRSSTSGKHPPWSERKDVIKLEPVLFFKGKSSEVLQSSVRYVYFFLGRPPARTFLMP